MKRHQIVWTSFSIQCLDEVYDFIFNETFSETIAQKEVNKLIARVDQLALFPDSGQIELLLKKIGQNSRYLVEGNYKIIYQNDEKKVIITDVFHTSQNPKKIISRSKKK